MKKFLVTLGLATLVLPAAAMAESQQGRQLRFWTATVDLGASFR